MKKIFIFTLITCLSTTYATSQISSKSYKDCDKAYNVTNKNKITVSENGGIGAKTNEIPLLNCLSSTGTSDVEYDSFWFKMSCVESGTLAFTITPNNPNEDIDFIVFESTGDCDKKAIIRCMGAGGIIATSPCMGPTGLRLESLDTEESAGCDPSKDNFVKILSMEVGKTYSVFVNTFTSSNATYDITFSGTAVLSPPLSNDEIDDSNFSIFPSVSALPAFNISTKNMNLDNVQLEVFSLEGKHIVTEKIFNENQRIELPNSVSNGIFMIKITADKQIFYKKFVYQR